MDQLAKNCSSLRQYGIKLTHTVFELLKIEIETISMFGDGVDQIPVLAGKGTFNSTDASYLYQSLPVCDGMLLESKLQILWSDFGSLDQPQPGIIAARVLYTGGSLVVNCDTPASCINTNGKVYRFPIKTGVEHYKIEQGSVEMFVPPPPRLIPPIPDDVFYPFSLS